MVDGTQYMAAYPTAFYINNRSQDLQYYLGQIEIVLYFALNNGPS